MVEPTVEAVEETDRMVAGEAERTEVLSVAQDPGGTGKTDGLNELSETEDDDSGTGRTDATLEVVEAGGETDRMDVLSEVQDPGGRVVGRVVGTNWMAAHLEHIFERSCEQNWFFEVPKMTSQGRVRLHQAFLRGIVGVFLGFWKRVGYESRI